MNTEKIGVTSISSPLLGRSEGIRTPGILLPKQNIIFDFYSIYAAFEHFMSTVCPFILNNPPTENGKEGCLSIIHFS